jgi:hypothetical protein
MKFLLSVIFTFIIICTKSQSLKVDEWHLTQYKGGVKIYLRKSSNSNVKEVLGIVTIKTSISALVYLVKDTENHYQWIYANKTAKLLKTLSDFEWIYYNESEAPWPVSNRDLITHAKMVQDKSTLIVTINSVGIPNYLPKKEGLVRVPKLYTEWVFTPRNYGMVEVRFELEIDLGGNIPAWLVNTSIDNGPLQTIQNMAKVLNQEKYKKINLPYIIEKKD